MRIEKVGNILRNTLLAACAGGVAATIFSAIVSSTIVRKPKNKVKLHIDLEFTLNGILGGLVAITACCDLVDNLFWAIAIGGLAGMLVVVVSNALHVHFRIDDPVGAFAVHGACGILGVVCCSIFGFSAGVQLFGVVILAAWSFLLSYSLFSILGDLGLLRVDKSEEILGLDRVYHRKSAYRIE